MDSLVKRAEWAQEFDGLRAIRLTVFVEKQGVPREEEMDALDDAAFHAVALKDGVVVGTGRLIVETLAQGLIGRMAVARPFGVRG